MALTLFTYDWVPELPRGYVRDVRVRWALEEAGLPYSVKSVPFKERTPEHIQHQPFAQVPYLMDGDLSIFESGAILLHLGELSEKLMPKTPTGRSEVIEWVFAALNSVEMPALPWTMYKFMKFESDAPPVKWNEDFLKLRLDRMEPVLSKREWLAGSFSVADILMADVLRVVDRFDGLNKHPGAQAYVKRATARPAFQKARADQIAHFAAAD
nr:glutathione S-transferase family protein [Aestuariivirga litoralis]